MIYHFDQAKCQVKLSIQLALKNKPDLELVFAGKRNFSYVLKTVDIFSFINLYRQISKT